MRMASPAGMASGRTSAPPTRRRRAPGCTLTERHCNLTGGRTGSLTIPATKTAHTCGATRSGSCVGRGTTFPADAAWPTCAPRRPAALRASTRLQLRLHRAVTAPRAATAMRPMSSESRSASSAARAATRTAVARRTPTAEIRATLGTT